MSSDFLDGRIPSEHLYDSPSGHLSIAPSIEKIRENLPYLAEQDSWLTWKWKDNGQKMPCRGADPRTSTSWEEPENTVSLAEAWEAYQEHDRLAGIGFVFNGTEDEVLEDFDDCVGPWDFKIKDECLEDALESSDEPAFFSTSGTGAHRYPVASDAKDTDQHPHEVYIGDGGNNRWAAITGWKIAGDDHGPDRSDEVNRLSDEYNEGAETVEMGNFEFDADPEEVDGDVTVPETIHAAFDGDVPECVAGLVHVLATHDPTDPDGPGWGQQTFMRYSHLLMLLADHLEPETPKELAEVAGSFRSPAIEAAQRGDHPTKPPQSERNGAGVPWDLGYQANMIRRKVAEDDLHPPALDKIESRCNVRLECDCAVHSGRYSPEPVAVLPPAARDLSSTASGWDWKHSARDTDLTIEEARERTTDKIAQVYEQGGKVLLEALPTMGKSYGSLKAAARTGVPISVFTGRGHKEQYAQLREWCDELGLSYYTLPSFTRDCDTANGEHGDDHRQTVMEWYRDGATPKEIHINGERALGRPLPCQEHEGGRCPYTSKWDFDPDDYDVLIGHYHHAKNDKVVQGRIPVFDEFPDAYETTLFDQRLHSAVSYWLSTVDALPFDDATELIERRDDPEARAEALNYFLDDDGSLTVERDEISVFDDPRAHADAPLAAFTLLAGDDLGNGFEQVSLDEDRVGVYNRKENEVRILDPPALDYTKNHATLALDGTPTKDMWELALGERLDHRKVLQDNERADYITEALNLQLVRTTEWVKPYNSADHVNLDEDAALLEKIGEEYDERPSVITTSTAEEEYDAGGIGDLVDEVKHHGNVLGSNEFDDKRLGAVIGSNHYGDDFIKRWGAYAGEVVERGEGKGADLSYGETGDKILRHMRENDTLQAAMRFGRDGHGAVVYVHTNTLPEWVETTGEARVVNTWSDGTRDVLRAAEGLGEWTTADLAEHPAVDVGERQVLNILHDLAERGVVEWSVDGRGFVWTDQGLREVSDHGEVELEPVEVEDLTKEEVHEISRSSIHTWNFVKTSANDDCTATDPAVSGPNGGETTPGTVETPPPSD